MPLVIPPGFASVGVVHEQENLLGSNPTWTLGWDSDDLEVLFGIYDEWLESDYKSNLCTEYAVVGLTIQTADGSTNGPLSKPGTAVFDPLPPQVATLIQKRTLTVGRSGRGRCYLPGLLSDAMVTNSGAIDSSRRIALTVMMQDLIDIADLLSVSPVLFHSAASDPTPITSLVCDGTVATQRNRLRS